MRVIAGEARGRRLKTLEGMDVRPTTDKVKEGLFNIIQFDLPGARFLDLFSGSGQIGIEALSRGAEYAVLNDQSRAAQQVIKENLISVGFYQRSRVVSMDAKAYLAATKERFHIAFLDPPYHKGILPEILPLVAQKMLPGSVILCEHEQGESLPEEFGDFRLIKQYRYGKICLSKFMNPVGDEE